MFVSTAAAAEVSIDATTGTISLGYRLGHIRGEPGLSRVGLQQGAVLHMLRRLVGDDNSSAGLYRDSRFHKVGTEDFESP